MKTITINYFLKKYCKTVYHTLNFVQKTTAFKKMLIR